LLADTQYLQYSPEHTVQCMTKASHLTKRCVDTDQY